MSFWSDPTVEPKRQYRWILWLKGLEHWVCRKVSKPSFEITEAPIQYLNHEFYYPGRIKWQPINLTVVDPVQPDSTAVLMEILKESGYLYPTNAATTKTISKVEATRALGTVFIDQLGPGEQPGSNLHEAPVIERWYLANAWLQNAKFGELDYEAEQAVNIDLVIRFDYAELNPKRLIGGRVQTAMERAHIAVAGNTASGATSLAANTIGNIFGS